MFVKFAKEHGIDVVNIVRRKEQVDMLKNIGAEHVLNSSNADFVQQFEELSDRVQPR